MLHNNRKVVLMIEDSPTQALRTSEILEEAGVSVLVAVNGASGLRLANQVRPNLVVLDINLPDMDGYEVCRLLREDDDTRDIPIVIMSRMSPEEVDRNKSCMGVVEFIPKDVFAHAVLIETIRQLGLMKSEIVT